MATLANGDARTALNILELAVNVAEIEPDKPIILSAEALEKAVQRRALLYDKDGEQHYDIISALHKTIRGSDPNAALYWLARMLEAGEDPLYIVRRLVRAASEDIGMADPQALVVAMAAQQAVHFIGMPEGELALAQCVVYLATAPKSNAVYTAYNQVKQDVHNSRNDSVPLHLRNAPTTLMKQLGYAETYKYAHDYEEGYIYQQNLPDSLEGKQYYQPTKRGFEKTISQRLDFWQTLAQQQKSKESPQ
jgi:putative ATPase